MSSSSELMKTIFLEDSYLCEFETSVESICGDHITLNATAFYPQSGGQPSDLGVLLREKERYKILGVEAYGEGIVHVIDKAGLRVGDEVHGIIDWDRRYRFMRSHTACHILSAVIFRETGARITGNQIDLNRSRVDFNLENFDKAEMRNYIDKANLIIKEDLPLHIRELPRDEAIKIPDLIRLAMDIPDREKIRVVEIEGTDLQACGGTHVKSTSEVRGITMAKAENKGKANRRIYFSLED